MVRGTYMRGLVAGAMLSMGAMVAGAGLARPGPRSLAEPDLPPPEPRRVDPAPPPPKPVREASWNDVQQVVAAEEKRAKKAARRAARR